MIDLYWNPDRCAVFHKTKEKHGGLSNMAAGYPIIINGALFRTSEALYQALRFPAHPEIQQKIIDQRSPIGAKMVGREHIDLTRPDWYDVRVDIMRWCLWMKFVQNKEAMKFLFNGTNNLQIVEKSNKDTFWGARLDIRKREVIRLVGRNVLGVLLTTLRDQQDYAYPVRGSLILGGKIDGPIT